MTTQSRTARDYMTTRLVSFTADMDIHRAMGLLLKHRVSGAPVVDERGALVGVLSERDCLTMAFHAGYHQDLGGKVGDYMSANVQTIPAGMNIVEVAERFFNSRFRRFPVVEGDRLVGQISRRDILRALVELWSASQ